ncbi:MAG: GlcNAc transferase, partial [Planctomycetia bacterium]|nr:GlcNAc transferase [Planctomycetia bacterium]
MPDDAHLYVLRAWYHRTEGRPDLALKDLDKAIQLEPRRQEALNLRGLVKRTSGDITGAVADFSKLIDVSPQEAPGYVGRAIVYMLEGKDVEART